MPNSATGPTKKNGGSFDNTDINGQLRVGQLTPDVPGKYLRSLNLSAGITSFNDEGFIIASRQVSGDLEQMTGTIRHKASDVFFDKSEKGVSPDEPVADLDQLALTKMREPDLALIDKMRSCAWFELTGNTPLVRISPKIYAKIETYNPSGSIKDRIIKYIIHKGILGGEVRSDTTLVEATSGNTGIALAACGAALGLDVIIYMPCNMSENRKIMMRKFGATLNEVGPNDFLGAVATRDKLLASDINKYWSPHQFDNEYNITCHLNTTCVEVQDQLPRGMIWEAFIHGAGTGGTMTAFMKFKDQERLNFKSMVVEPAEDAESHGIQGIYDGADFLLRRSTTDGVITVSTENAKKAADIIAKKHGIMVGISSGANYIAARQYVKEFNPTGAVVTIFADRGERYM